MFWNSQILPHIVDHFLNEGKYKLWSFIAELIGGERVRDFTFCKHVYEVYAVVYGQECTYRLS